MNDDMTKPKFDYFHGYRLNVPNGIMHTKDTGHFNVYGCCHALPDGIIHATDMKLESRRTLVCGSGD
eukprot:13336839-Heterocapsa_arctica.AAC.1